MLSFRVERRDATEAQRWAEALGIDRSELLREALRRHLDRLATEGDMDRWIAAPLDAGERGLGGHRRLGACRGLVGLVRCNGVRSGSPPRQEATDQCSSLLATLSPIASAAVVVAAVTRTRRGLVSELELTRADGVPTDSVVNFDNIHTIARDTFRRRVTTLPPAGWPRRVGPPSGHRVLTRR